MGLDDFANNSSGPDVEDQDEYPDEDGVVSILYHHLDEKYDNVKTYERTSPDIIATSGSKKYKIEVKGDNDSPKDRVYTGLGQVVYEMAYDDISNENIHWAIAFPAKMGRRTEYRERVSNNISSQILELLDISVIIVSEDGDIEWNDPGEIGDQN
jgi:Holliday junction resolvase